MPHKRAKRVDRLSERERRGEDLPPWASGGTSVAQESVPKSFARVLDAENVRKNYREKRLQRSDDTSDEEPTVKRRRKDTRNVAKKLEIKHGESLAHFSRRIDDDKRVPIAEAMHNSRSRAKRTKKFTAKKDAQATRGKSIPIVSAPVEKLLPLKPARVSKTGFDPVPSAKRLNDIVQAPPIFTKLPRAATKASGRTNGKSDLAVCKANGVVSMAQKQMMEEERERVIRRYREQKERRRDGRTPKT